jgi:hypothetical protein
MKWFPNSGYFPGDERAYIRDPHCSGDYTPPTDAEVLHRKAEDVRAEAWRKSVSVFAGGYECRPECRGGWRKGSPLTFGWRVITDAGMGDEVGFVAHEDTPTEEECEALDKEWHSGGYDE